MYQPAHFRMRDSAAIHALMRAASFATLVSTDEDGLPALSHLPFHLAPSEGEFGCLYGHMARANPQWRHFDRPVLASFLGPHAYVSPSWYASEPNVPTWNYMAAEAAGRAEIIDEPAEARALLGRLVADYEGEPPAWTMAAVPDSYTEAMIRGIVAFRIPIQRLEGKAKLSQNKSEADRAGVIAALRRGGDPLAALLAAKMQETMP